MFELRLHCSEDQVEAIGDALDAAGASSVSIEDAEAGTSDEEALFGEPGAAPIHDAWRHSRILALFSSRQAAETAARELASESIEHRPTITGVFELPEQDWVRLTQTQFEPVEITPDFWIVPSWHQPPEAARRLIRLDPGLAFGTGTHPTTRMCLRWIAARPGKFRRVLDYGCGSGILAIGAARYGATEVDAVDIDPAAVDSTRANADANHVQVQAGTPEMAGGTYNLVLANILASPLKVLAPLLCARLASGGFLVLAGILERQADELIDVYATYAPLKVADAQDGWILMTAAG